MDKLFLTVLGMSATASIAVFIVLLVRLPLRRAPKVFSYALWAVVLFRLLCPFTLKSAVGLIPSVSTVSAMGDRSTVQIQTSIPAGNVPVNGSPAGLPGQPGPVLSETPDSLPGETVPSGNAPFDWLAAACVVWLIGAAVLLAYSAVSLLRLRRKLVGAVPLAGEKRVRRADHISSPFVLGLFRPVIYLPSGFPERERDYVLLHERTHIRRGDHIFRALAWLALAVHWFNPLVWLAFHLAGRDMEMSCDETVLRRMGRDIRTDYSSSLLRLSAGGKLPAGPLAFGGSDPERRIKNVLRYKKPALWVVVAALAGVVVTTTVLAASRTAEPPADTPDTTDTPDITFDVRELDADLSFFSRESGDVEITGSVGDFTLREGTIWHPAADAIHPASYLSMRYPPFNDSIESVIYAWWADDSRTAVTVSTHLSAMLSSQFNAGWWTFTVDLDSGTVTEMTSHPVREGLPESEIRAYPASIPDWEAVKAARAAALLLTEAEDFYHSSAVPLSVPELEMDPVYTLDDLWVTVNIDGLDCDWAWWNAKPLNDSYKPENALGCLEIWEPRFFGEAFSETYKEIIALYNPEDPNGLIWLYLYTRDYNCVCCTVDLITGAVTEYTLPGFEPAGSSFSVQEMLPAARALARLIQEASDYYAAATDIHEEGPLPFDKPMKLWFGSGAGGWSTILTLHPDGSFEGDYADSSVRINYVCRFHGRFGDITQTSAASWSMTLEELVLDTGHPIGEQWTEDWALYVSSEPYGMDGANGKALEPGAQFVFYTPDAAVHTPDTELYGMEEFLRWWPLSRDFLSAGDKLDCYGLCNVETGYGFFSLDAWGMI